MIPAGTVLIWDDHNAATVMHGVVAELVPLARALWAGSGDQADLDEVVGIFFALADKDQYAGIGGDQRGKAIEDAIDTFEIVDPSAVTIGPALPEPLGVEPHDLIEQLTLAIVVVVH